MQKEYVRTAADLGRTIAAAEGLVLFRSILRHPALQALQKAARAGCNRSVFATFLHLLAESKVTAAGTGNCWQRLLQDLVLFDDNPFTRACELSLPTHPYAPALAHDLTLLQRLHNLSLRPLEMECGGMELLGSLPAWVQPAGPLDQLHAALQLPSLLANSANWAGLIPQLTEFYSKAGAGRFARYAAFRWPGEGAEGEPQPIANPDPVRLADLAEYEEERALVVANTEAFLAGLPAQNVLLYGDRGTGKSATVKALLWEYAARGLRLVEVSRHHLHQLPHLFAYLGERGQKYIVFIDDLSFDDGETAYKDLKAILEGGLAARPHNVLVYVTSNRRHLVEERMSDRQNGAGADDDVHPGEGWHEKLSVADRFGLTVVYRTPDQKRYLRIVAHLLSRRQVEQPASAWSEAALHWAMWHHGLSPRSAQQFVDDWCAKLGRPDTAPLAQEE